MSVEALSLCMIVKNEENRLARCLDSVSGLRAELVITDTGSTDRTQEIAAGYGAKISSFDFTVVDFAAARNHALGRAHGRWILVLDADETLDARSVPLIQEIARTDDNAGYYFQRLNRRLDSGAPSRDYVVRLFPNRPDYRYRGRVHETIDASILSAGGSLLRSEICIEHDFAPDPDQRRLRNLSYVAILNEEIDADPSDHTRYEFLAAEYHQLGMFEQAVQIAERITAMRPLDARAHFHAGAYHWLYQRDRERARADFKEALRLRPGYAEARSFLQLVEQEEGPQTVETAE